MDSAVSAVAPPEKGRQTKGPPFLCHFSCCLGLLTRAISTGPRPDLTNALLAHPVAVPGISPPLDRKIHRFPEKTVDLWLGECLVL